MPAAFGRRGVAVKLCSYTHLGEPSYGVLTDTGIIDLGASLGARFPTLVKLLEGDAVSAAREAASRLDPVYRITDVKFLPLTLEPVNIICQGMNFRSHLEELGRGRRPVSTRFLQDPASARRAPATVGHAGSFTLLRLRGRVLHRDRQSMPSRQRSRRDGLRSRLHDSDGRLGSGLSAADHVPGQEFPALGSVGAVHGHSGRGPRRGRRRGCGPT